MDKEKIIAEIQRTAKENGNKPLGLEKFSQTTGIKTAEWYGKFWAKWSDAVKEAGYLPNKMQDAYPEELLLESYALFVREIGHVPTSPELRMKARSDGNFPSHNTFSRFGSKQQFLAQLVIFCRQTPNYADLVPILEKTAKTASHPEENDKKSQDNDGYVYLLQFGEEYKIGSSNNVERRFREIKTQMPYEGKIIHTIETGDPAGIEAYWHHHFKNKRLKGEWFKLTTDDVKYFRKRKLM